MVGDVYDFYILSISDMADYQKMDVDAPGAEMVDDLQLGAAADVLGMRSVFRALIQPGFKIGRSP